MEPKKLTQKELIQALCREGPSGIRKLSKKTGIAQTTLRAYRSGNRKIKGPASIACRLMMIERMKGEGYLEAALKKAEQIIITEG